MIDDQVHSRMFYGEIICRAYQALYIDGYDQQAVNSYRREEKGAPFG